MWGYYKKIIGTFQILYQINCSKAHLASAYNSPAYECVTVLKVDMISQEQIIHDNLEP